MKPAETFLIKLYLKFPCKAWGKPWKTHSWESFPNSEIKVNIFLQTSVHEWVRNHRVHHKYSDTDADPHNVYRGFFFTHYGWMLLRKHPDVKEKGKKVDTSDLDADPLLMFQKRSVWLWLPLKSFYLICRVIPMVQWRTSGKTRVAVPKSPWWYSG